MVDIGASYRHTILKAGNILVVFWSDTSFTYSSFRPEVLKDSFFCVGNPDNQFKIFRNRLTND